MNKEIVWLEDPLNYAYLRETVYMTTSPLNIRLKLPFGNKRPVSSLMRLLIASMKRHATPIVVGLVAKNARP